MICTETGLAATNHAFAAVGTKIAIEADGPSHFMTNTLMPVGSHRSRLLLLAARGWTVICVAGHDWERASYLDRVLMLEQVRGPFVA